MTNIELLYFVKIDFTQLNEYYSAETEYGGLRLDLKSVSEDKATGYINFYFDELDNKELSGVINAIKTTNKI